jgi:MFS family permease
VVTLLERDGASRGVAGGLGALTLLAGFVTRPLAGWLVRRRADDARLIVAASLAVGAAATAVLALPGMPLAVLGLACGVLGLAAGFPFAPAFAGAQAARPDAPAAAVGLVNTWAAFSIVVGTPLVGLTFSLPGDGRIGFACVAALWAASLATVPSARRLAASPRPR